MKLTEWVKDISVEYGMVDDWNKRNPVSVTIGVKEDGMISFSAFEKRRVYSMISRGENITFNLIDTIELPKAQAKKFAVDIKPLLDLLNRDEEIAFVALTYRVTTETIKIKFGDWKVGTSDEYETILQIKPECIDLLNSECIRNHPYLPSHLELGENRYNKIFVKEIYHFLDDSLTLNQQTKFPSFVEVEGASPLHMDWVDFLKIMYNKSTKKRLDFLAKSDRWTRIHGDPSRHRYRWNGEVIPPEIYDTLTWPLEEHLMFTLNML